MRPVRDDTEFGSAPVSAQANEQCFWDHLGATRAEEYAAEDILDLCPEPVGQPVISSASALDSRPDSASKADFADIGRVTPPAPSEAARQAWMAMAQPIPRRVPRKPLSAAQSRRARWSYRLQRIWLTPFYRAALTRGLPLALVLGVCALLLANAQNRAQLVAWGQAAYSAVVDRPEFMVSDVKISPVAPELDRSIRARLAEELPSSSFRLDLPALRAEIESYDSVEEAALRLGADGKMFVTVRERAPVALWHSGREMQLLDIEGHRVALLAPDAPLPDLPLLAGVGAQTHVREALALLDAALPLGDRLRGLVRVGARRWDVVLDREQRIRLPEQGAMQALERVLALDQAQDLLARDVLSVDMRNPYRPVLNVSPGALETLRAIRGNQSEALQ